ncbi:hypothetical protein CCZ01_09525, partial [Helicobacter monodelphidis]|uniref:hypothetical protein n=1 Tax=Helicobacter sp. 15-1451 TaxID=2004995 RepID=UPI000DCF17F3
MYCQCAKVATNYDTISCKGSSFYLAGDINIFRFDRDANTLKRYIFTGEFGDMYLRGIDTSFRYIQACKVPDDEEYDEKGQCFLFDI